MARRITVALDTADYLSLPVTSVSLTTTERRRQIVLSLLTLALDRGTWEPMSDSAWDAWAAGLAELLEELQA